MKTDEFTQENMKSRDPFSAVKHICLAMALMIAVVLPFFVTGTVRAVESGSLIRGVSHSAVYFYGSDGKRYSFPNERTYFTWYMSFKGVQTISDAELAAIPLGGVVTHKPGSRMVKIVSDPKVYVVDKGGLLRWVKTEAVARALYGTDWNKRIDDIPVSLFVNYTSGDPIEDVAEFSPSYAQLETPDIDYDREYRLGIRTREAWSTRAHQLSCGDGICSYGEISETCPSDCGPAAVAPASPVCGDGICGTGESTSSCVTDCPAPEPEPEPAVCGNWVCETGENSESCWYDCPYDFGHWKTRVDALTIPGLVTGTADDGRFFLRSGDAEIRIPSEDSYDYGKFRLYNMMICQEQVEEIMGTGPTRFPAIRTRFIIGESDRNHSTCCREEWIDTWLMTIEYYDDHAFGEDAYWRLSSTDWETCIGGHEETHFVSDHPLVFEEGLATYIADILRGRRGGDISLLEECRDDGYVVAYEGFTPYVLIDTDAAWADTRLESYRTSACFWKHIDDTYGRAAFQEVYASMIREMDGLDRADGNLRNMQLVDRAVVPVVGEGIWSFVSNMLENHP